MNELAKHIEILLLENDCVIVPNFGGFIAHYQPARYVEAENLYLPPMRTIGFNPQLKMNDGLLVQSYMQVYQTDFPDATRKIEKQVEELEEMLYKEGKVNIQGIGVLHYTIYNSYEFHPNEDGVLSPTLYGLSSFSFRRIENTGYTIPSTKELTPRVREERTRIRFNRQWLGNAAAVAAAIILFFFLSVPVENTYVDKGNYASLGTDGLFDAIRSQSLATTLVTVPVKQQGKTATRKEKASDASTTPKNLKPVAVRVEKVAAPAPETAKKEVAVKAAKVETAKPEQPKPTPAPVKKAETVSTNPSYHIVIASLATAADAQQTLNAYKQKGYKDAVIIEGNGRYRLSIGEFTDKTAAYRKLNELKQNEAFKNAWLLNSK